MVALIRPSSAAGRDRWLEQIWLSANPLKTKMSNKVRRLHHSMLARGPDHLRPQVLDSLPSCCMNPTTPSTCRNVAHSCCRRISRPHMASYTLTREGPSHMLTPTPRLLVASDFHWMRKTQERSRRRWDWVRKTTTCCRMLSATRKAQKAGREGSDRPDRPYPLIISLISLVRFHSG